ncbi:MAG: DUF1080 domain-containing protein [Pirellulaceae bacterium]|nr:DUF1080 domain-containing protein [Pirellulaceae bacterium]
MTFRRSQLLAASHHTIACRLRCIGVATFLALLPCVSALAQPAAADAAHAIDAPQELRWYEPSFWETVDGRPVEESWQFSQGEIRLHNPRGGRGSLLSPAVPVHFELSFQWMIEPGANNGLKYRVRSFDDRWLGIEYQMIDERIPLAKPHIGSTASIYDLVAPALEKPLLPAGQWNQSRIVSHGSRLEHYLNGSLVASIQTDSVEWYAAMARSKFDGLSNFGQPQPGDRILLTDHGGQAAYRGFELIELPPPDQQSQPEKLSPQLGNGLRNGWADQTSIVLWTRTTARSEMLGDGGQFVPISRDQQSQLSASQDADKLLHVQLPEGATLDQMHGACPGAAGEVRLTYFPEAARGAARTTDWVETVAQHDFTHQWQLDRLFPGTSYAAIIEARPVGQSTLTAVLRGRFQTAPSPTQPRPVTFCMTTCHDYVRRDDGDLGHKIYPAMTRLEPNFVVHAGDIEYYDMPDPWAWTIDLMRFKWARLFALPNNRQFYNRHTAYFMKDDHDTLKNDCWAGQHYGAVTFEQGVELFNLEQFPARQPRYATICWGPDLQIWLLEGRDYRSPNTLADGPEKTILGAEQKAWLLESLRSSSARYKLVFSPTPIVGPDRENKNDNHANQTFTYEGQQLRQAFAETGNVIVFCGDRHWQYASVDPQTGLWEFGCGPGSQRHQLGWQEGDVRPEHRFLRVQGGFLSGTLSYSESTHAPELTLRHHDVTGQQVSSFQFPPAP